MMNRYKFFSTMLLSSIFIIGDYNSVFAMDRSSRSNFSDFGDQSGLEDQGFEERDSFGHDSQPRHSRSQSATIHVPHNEIISILFQTPHIGDLVKIMTKHFSDKNSLIKEIVILNTGVYATLKRDEDHDKIYKEIKYRPEENDENILQTLDLKEVMKTVLSISPELLSKYDTKVLYKIFFIKRAIIRHYDITHEILDDQYYCFNIGKGVSIESIKKSVLSQSESIFFTINAISLQALLCIEPYSMTKAAKGLLEHRKYIETKLLEKFNTLFLEGEYTFNDDSFILKKKVSAFITALCVTYRNIDLLDSRLDDVTNVCRIVSKVDSGNLTYNNLTLKFIHRALHNAITITSENRQYVSKIVNYTMEAIHYYDYFHKPGFFRNLDDINTQSDRGFIMMCFLHDVMKNTEINTNYKSVMQRAMFTGADYYQYLFQQEGDNSLVQNRIKYLGCNHSSPSYENDLVEMFSIMGMIVAGISKEENTISEETIEKCGNIFYSGLLGYIKSGMQDYSHLRDVIYQHCQEITEQNTPSEHVVQCLHISSILGFYIALKDSRNNKGNYSIEFLPSQRTKGSQITLCVSRETSDQIIIKDIEEIVSQHFGFFVAHVPAQIRALIRNIVQDISTSLDVSPQLSQQYPMYDYSPTERFVDQRSSFNAIASRNFGEKSKTIHIEASEAVADPKDISSADSPVVLAEQVFNNSQLNDPQLNEQQ